VAALLLATRVASADDADAAIKRGIELRRHGKDREALAEFEQAWNQAKLPRARAQMGLAEQALGLWLPAGTHIREALSFQSDGWVQSNRTVLEQALATIDRHLGRLEVWGEPAGAEVRVDDKPIGTLPLQDPARFDAGDVTLEVRANGFVPTRRAVHLDPGQLTREHVALRPLSAAVVPPGGGEVTGGIQTSGGAASGGAGGEARPVYKKWWFWTIAGAVAVAAGATVIALAGHGSSSSPCASATCSTWGTGP
jgi:hypothetical protein